MSSFCSVSAEVQLTPMMAQYRRIKGELPGDAILLFRLGDFYEMFFEDAQTGARILNLALTARNGVPMCGLPFHAPTLAGFFEPAARSPCANKLRRHVQANSSIVR
jgi:hypothetical protein